MRRIQIYLDEEVDDALSAAARRQGTSKADLIRRSVARDVVPEQQSSDPWDALIGWLDIDPIEDLDAVIYEDGH